MDPILCLLFLGISTLYSSIGFGGGSSYIAVLILWNVHPITVTIIAALCNIVVTFNSSILYFKNKNNYNKRNITIYYIKCSFFIFRRFNKNSNKIFVYYIRNMSSYIFYIFNYSSYSRFQR